MVLSIFFAIIAPIFAADPGPALFDAHGCRACHKIGAKGGNTGPDLTLVGHRRPKAWIEKWLASPKAYKPDTEMPEQRLPPADRAALAAFLSERRGQDWGGERPWKNLSGPAQGKLIYAAAGCAACHGAGGRGGHPNPGAVGGVIPALPKLLSSYTKDELVNKLRSGAVPDTGGGPPAAAEMPAWDGILSAPELSALADWLLSIAVAGKDDL